MYAIAMGQTTIHSAVTVNVQHRSRQNKAKTHMYNQRYKTELIVHLSRL